MDSTVLIGADDVRSAGHAIREAAHAMQQAASQMDETARTLTYALQDHAMATQRPSVLFRPALSLDGNQWCALYGANLQDGVAGFGNTPDAAMAAFDAAWTSSVAALTQKGGEDGAHKSVRARA